MIQHFRAGILRLPDGMTLRGYLAARLNSDPMRITKKYAGASCLGKRTFSFCERSILSVGDIEMANVQLKHLEERFKLRLETGHPGIPLPYSPLATTLSSSSNSLEGLAGSGALIPPSIASLVSSVLPNLPNVNQTQMQNMKRQLATATTPNAPTSTAASGLNTPSGLTGLSQHNQQQSAIALTLSALLNGNSATTAAAAAATAGQVPAAQLSTATLQAAFLSSLTQQSHQPAATAVAQPSIATPHNQQAAVILANAILQAAQLQQQTAQ